MASFRGGATTPTIRTTSTSATGSVRCNTGRPKWGEGLSGVKVARRRRFVMVHAHTWPMTDEDSVVLGFGLRLALGPRP